MTNTCAREKDVTSMNDKTTWECPNCHESVESQFDACWNCGTTRDGTQDEAFKDADPAVPEDLAEAANPYTAPQSEPGSPVRTVAGSDICVSANAAELLDRTRWAVHFMAIVSGLTTVFVAIRFYYDLQFYLNRETTGIALLFDTTFVDYLLFVKLFLAPAFAVIGVLLWRYAQSIHEFVHAQTETLDEVFAAQKKAWTTTAIVFGFFLFTSLAVLAYAFLK